MKLILFDQWDKFVTMFKSMAGNAADSGELTKGDVDASVEMFHA